MRYATSLAFIVAVLALAAYGVVGESGPVGWLNGLQAANDGHYSRVVSTLLLFLAAGVVLLGPLLLWHVVREKVLGRPPARVVPQSWDPPLPALKPPAVRGLRYLVLLLMVALTWSGSLAWHAWDWQRRSVDATSDYTAVRLDRHASPARAADGSHLELQGRLLWERGLVHRTEQNGVVSEEVYVPIAGADWQPGDAVHFVVKLRRAEAMPVVGRLGEAPPPLAVRVDGAIPGATRPVFQKGGVPMSEDAVLVHFVDPGRGRPADAHPVFDWQATKEVGGWSSAFVAALWLTVLGSLKVKAWQRRRAARAGRAPA